MFRVDHGSIIRYSFTTFRTIRSPLSFDGERMDSVTAPPVLGEADAELRGPIPERKRA